MIDVAMGHVWVQPVNGHAAYVPKSTRLTHSRPPTPRAFATQHLDPKGAVTIET
jgi:hypothetical protein